MGNSIKFFFLIFFILLSLPYFSFVQEVKVGVKEILESEITSFKYNSLLESGEPFKVSFELFNSGSVGYRARVRLDIINQTNLYYTGWSEEKSLWPGSSGYFEVHWYPVNITGDLEARVMIYYANDIKELKPIKFKIVGIGTPEKDIEITGFKTYEDRIVVGLKSNKELEDIIIVPSGYLYGWIFEQSKIEKISKDEEKKVELKYEPTIWKETEVMIHVFTEDGKYYTSKSFLMKIEKSNVNILSYFVKIIKIFWLSPLF